MRRSMPLGWDGTGGIPTASVQCVFRTPGADAAHSRLDRLRAWGQAPHMAEPSGIRLAQQDRSPVERATELAARHSGSIATRQLLAVGFTRLTYRTVGHRGSSPSRATRASSPGAAPTYRSKGSCGRPSLRRARGGPRRALHAVVEVASPSQAGLRSTSTLPGSRHRAMTCAFGIQRRSSGSGTRELPVVPLPQALLLAAGALEHDSLRFVLARAEFKGCVSLQGLERALGRGRSGSVAVRAAMNAHLPQLAKCENGLEREYVLLCERYGIEIPDPNEPIGRYRPDMLWRHRDLIVELDGWRAHHTPAQLGSDARKQKALEGRGFAVKRFTRDEVFESPAGRSPHAPRAPSVARTGWDHVAKRGAIPGGSPGRGRATGPAGPPCRRSGPCPPATAGSWTHGGCGRR